LLYYQEHWLLIALVDVQLINGAYKLLEHVKTVLQILLRQMELEHLRQELQVNLLHVLLLHALQLVLLILTVLE
jgi:hypothetical protein